MIQLESEPYQAITCDKNSLMNERMAEIEAKKTRCSRVNLGYTIESIRSWSVVDGFRTRCFRPWIKGR